LILWGVLFSSVVRIVPRPASLRPLVPGAGIWDLSQPVDMPKLGSRVPDVTLVSREGWRCPLSAYRGRRMLLCFFRGDTPNTPLVQEWEKIHRSDPDAVVLGISASGPGGGPNFRQTTHVTFPLLFDPSYHFAKRREPVEYPITAVVDEKGKVVSVSHKPENPANVVRKLRASSLIKRAGARRAGTDLLPHSAAPAPDSAPPAHGAAEAARREACRDWTRAREAAARELESLENWDREANRILTARSGCGG
jgi:peroxiredoxin